MTNPSNANPSNTDITSHLQENRTFAPSADFAGPNSIDAVRLEALHAQAAHDHEGFWAEYARQLAWKTPFTKTLDWQPPHARWFYDGTLNVTDSCLDRHVKSARRHKAALVFEGEPGDTQTLTYSQLHDAVCRFAGALRNIGVDKDDRVAIYMPMVPEAMIAMLACARLGAIHSVIFGGFSSDSLRDRINDAGCKVVITADGGHRRGQIVHLKSTVDKALSNQSCPSIQRVVVLRRIGQEIDMQADRDVFWHDLLRPDMAGHPVWESVEVEAEHPLFILYTSGTTGKPKGVVHSTAGYLTQVSATAGWAFDFREDDLFWCTADVGWITGHSYVTYGPLSRGATVFLYEGAPTYPDADRFWQMIERHRVSILYTAPTAIRTFMRLGDQHVKKHDLSSLRLLGSVGEPINPEAWMWYRRVVGNDQCPIIDTWWQTETGGMMISPLPAATSTKPGSATRPLPGIDAHVVKKDGSPCQDNEGGFLVVKKPWPSMMRTVWGDDERFKQTYWVQIEGTYFTGDGARRDPDGYVWVMGRVDDVVNVSGHRLGTMEVESALVSHASVSEAAVVGRPDEVKGQGVVAFVTLRKGEKPSDELKKALAQQVATEIGSFARPDEIRFADALPKTRSGKIMRRLLRELAQGGEIKGDVTSLEDLSVLAALRTNDDE